MLTQVNLAGYPNTGYPNACYTHTSRPFTTFTGLHHANPDGARRIDGFWSCRANRTPQLGQLRHL